MTDSDREVILRKVKDLLAKKTPILITHGTDTMVQTGLYLKRELTELKTPIVLTGAMTRI